MAELDLVVDTPDRDTEERFIREYVVPAVERLGDRYDVQFWGRYSTSNQVDGGRVKLTFEGDPAAIRAGERDRWEQLDYIDGWEADVPGEQETVMTDAEQELTEQLARTAAAMNVEYFDAFEERPPVGAASEERFHERGVWVLVHLLLNQQGYSPEEEVDVLFLALRDRLARIHAEDGMERVGAVVDDLHERLDETETAIERRFDDA